MTQRIITVSHRAQRIDDNNFNLDQLTAKINADGWIVKQIVSTSFKVSVQSGVEYPTIAITLLIEKED